MSINPLQSTQYYVPTRLTCSAVRTLIASSKSAPLLCCEKESLVVVCCCFHVLSLVVTLYSFNWMKENRLVNLKCDVVVLSSVVKLQVFRVCLQFRMYTFALQQSYCKKNCRPSLEFQCKKFYNFVSCVQRTPYSLCCCFRKRVKVTQFLVQVLIARWCLIKKCMFLPSGSNYDFIVTS